MIRSWIKAGAAGMLVRTGLDRIVTGSKDAPVVLGYHRVVEDFASSSANSIPAQLISVAMLERHLDWIGRSYRFVDLDELGLRLESGEPGDPIAAVTFDDGYRDFYTHAWPLLQKKGIPSALFVVTDHVGTKRVQAHDKLYSQLARRAGKPIPRICQGIFMPDTSSMNPFQAVRTLLEALPLSAIEKVVAWLENEHSIPDAEWESFRSVTWDMLLRMQRSGVIVGSHTKTHTVMANETPERLREEAAGSRAVLEQRLGTPVQHFAYPSGSFNTAAVNAVAAAGYRFGYTTCTHRSAEYPLLTVPRGLLWENACLDSNRSFSGAIMSCQVRRTFELVAGCRQSHNGTVSRGNHA